MLTITAIALSACLLSQATPAPTPAPAQEPAIPAAAPTAAPVVPVAPVAPAPRPVIETAELVGAPTATTPANAAANGTTAGQPLLIQPAGTAPVAQSNPLNFLFLTVGMVAVLIIFSTWTGRKQKKRTQTLLDSLKNNDKVQTTSGIIGTIAEIRDNEVVLRVDEASNTRIRFNKMAIQQVLRPAGGKDTPASLAIETKTGGQKTTV